MKNKTIVLIPHYNDPEGLQKTVTSIHEDERVDLLIVDDGSNDVFDEKLISKVFKSNGEIFFIYLQQNQGIENALNFGLKKIIDLDYEFIGRLDSGDLCLGQRFKIQESFFNDNPELKLIGSHVKIVDTKGSFLYNLRVPLYDYEIRKKIYLSSSVLIHPAIAFRKEVILRAGFYPTEYKASEDYAFYFEVLKKFKVGNVNEILLEKELNPNSISIKKRKTQAYNRLRVICHNLYFGYYPILGLIRNIILLLMPLKIITIFKNITYLRK
ncbi:MAG: glycosyltransferase [Flavobacterium sp.]|nr:glycosyltransferase [Flavobacterium sp.]